MKKSFTFIIFLVVLALAFTWHGAGGIGRGAGGGGSGSTGDTNGDGTVDIADAIHILRYLFIDANSPPVPCMAQGASMAQEVSFDPAGTSMTALNVQEALRELDRQVQELKSSNALLSQRLSAVEGTNPVSLELVPIPPGTFTMGSPGTERGHESNEAPHVVTLTKNIKMGATEVTQAQYQAVMGNNPSGFFGCPECPVEGINWYDAVAFGDQLTAKHRLDGTIGPNDKYRLPTEAEWEYACRAGTSTRFFFGDALNCKDDGSFCALADEYMWYFGNTFWPTNGPHPVGQKKPNAWGLYDMLGNVGEYCSDWFEFETPTQPTIDPQGPSSSSRTQRVIRGSFWTGSLGSSRSASRCNCNMSTVDRTSTVGIIGFRVVLEIGG